MRTPFTPLYLHFVWATWDRHPYLVEPLRSRVYGCIQGECGRLGADVIAIGGVEDHVHVLVRVPATIAPATKRDVPAIRDYINNQEQHHREQRLDPAVEPLGQMMRQ